MANGYTGLDAKCGAALESVYGTYHVPDRAWLFNDEKLAFEIPRLESEGIGVGDYVQRTGQWTTGRKQGKGDLTLDVSNKGMGILFEMMMGDASKTADGAGWKHTFKIGSTRGKSMTFQVGRPSTDGTINPFSYLGCKIESWKLKQDVEGFLNLAVTVDIREESMIQTLAAVSVPSVFELFAWKTLSVTVDGDPFDPTGLELDGENPMKTDRFFLNGTDLKKEPIDNGKRKITGKISGEFENMDQYDRFVNADPGVPSSMVPIVFTWTGVSTYDSGKPFKLVATYAACRFDGATPSVKGPDVLEGEWDFTALYNGSQEVVQFDLYTSDATP